MEKNTTAVPKEFIERIESLERQLAALKEELAVFLASPAVETPAEAPSEAVDIDIDIIDMPDMPAVPDISPAEIPAADVEIPLPEIDDLPAGRTCRRACCRSGGRCRTGRRACGRTGS